MAIKNIFKKQNAKKNSEPEKKAPVKKTSKKKRASSEFSFRVLNSAHVTEKATDLVKNRQYVFNVSPDSNKNEIKRAVEDTFGVNVESVRTIKIPGRKRRIGRHEGWKSGYRKAIVKIAKGQEIEILPK
jgi:large subunit ribosomal protein L23